ncbi:MAG: ribose-phosphate pyrophosphokinase [Chloroflexi bacterium]|nr:MAG: ribose-phosphate pyrophosphokinase [Chloroflexota bacterium]
MSNELVLFTGNANPALAAAIAAELGVPLGKARVDRFPDGETRVQIRENVRGRDAFVIQPTCPPVNEHLMELLILIDALRRSSAGRITAVVPYYGYARQEKMTIGREPITAKLVADLLMTAGAERLLTLDLHAPAIAGFFHIPVDNLPATPLMAAYFQELALDDAVTVAPDAGGVRRALDFAHRLETPVVFITKHRPAFDEPHILGIVGDVEGKTAIIIDDMISSGGTLLQTTEILLARGARAVYACATHPVFAGDAAERLRQSPLRQIVVTDTIPLRPDQRWPSLTVLSVAPLFAEAIRRIHEERSVSALFR